MNTEDVVLNLGIGKYKVSWITILNDTLSPVVYYTEYKYIIQYSEQYIIQEDRELMTYFLIITHIYIYVMMRLEKDSECVDLQQLVVFTQSFPLLDII